MVMRIPPGEPVEPAIYRLLQERTRRACKELKVPLGNEGIHDVRRELKRLRALLDLVDHRWPTRQRRRWRERLRRCSRELSEVRDAWARIQSLSLVPPDERTGLSDRFWMSLGRGLKREARAATRCWNRRHRFRVLRRRLQSLGQNQSPGRPARDGWRLLADGLQATYRQSRQDLRQVEARPTTTHCHRWRKSVKRLGCQLTLLRPTQSPSLAGWAFGLDRLGSRLGDEHDLFLLREYLRSDRKRAGTRGEAKRLSRLIQSCRRRILEAAVSLGKRLFLMRSSEFRRRVDWHGSGQGPGPALPPKTFTHDARWHPSGSDPASEGTWNRMRNPGPAQTPRPERSVRARDSVPLGRLRESATAGGIAGWWSRSVGIRYRQFRAARRLRR